MNSEGVTECRNKLNLSDGGVRRLDAVIVRKREDQQAGDGNRQNIHDSMCRVPSSISSRDLGWCLLNCEKASDVVVSCTRRRWRVKAGGWSAAPCTKHGGRPLGTGQPSIVSGCREMFRRRGPGRSVGSLTFGHMAVESEMVMGMTMGGVSGPELASPQGQKSTDLEGTAQ